MTGVGGSVLEMVQSQQTAQVGCLSTNHEVKGAAKKEPTTGKSQNARFLFPIVIVSYFIATEPVTSLFTQSDVLKCGLTYPSSHSLLLVQ